jgi:hypothetical protein
MNRPTVCISSIVKEPHNIKGFEEPQGAVETEDLFQQGKSMKPPSYTVDTMIWKKANTTYMPGHRDSEQSSASIRYGTFEQYIEAQQQYAWLFRHTLCSIKFQDLVDAIKEGRDIAISDGSHKNKRGTSS